MKLTKNQLSLINHALDILESDYDQGTLKYMVKMKNRINLLRKKLLKLEIK